MNRATTGASGFPKARLNRFSVSANRNPAPGNVVFNFEVSSRVSNSRASGDWAFRYSLFSEMPASSLLFSRYCWRPASSITYKGASSMSDNNAVVRAVFSSKVTGSFQSISNRTSSWLTSGNCDTGNKNHNAAAITSINTNPVTDTNRWRNTNFNPVSYL